MTSAPPATARSFPVGFVWGAATASYQIEGAVAEDGRTPSIWDTFSHTPGTILNGDTGDVADDHYHRMPQDVALMAELGLQSYRFSISWSRVLPHGREPVNPAGIGFYSRLVDELLGQDITPIVTLYHWDLPQELQDAGGWASRDTSARFAEYAQVVAVALGDRIGTWTTFNEPWVVAFLGHSTGVHAPGIKDDATALTAVHHLNLAHGLGVTALRATLPPAAQVSITLNLANVRPASGSAADVGAARLADGLCNRVFLEPILDGRYPADVVEASVGFTDFSFVQDGDLAVINQPIDVLGINYYAPARVAAATDELRALAADSADNDPMSVAEAAVLPGTDRVFAVAQDGPHTDMGWPIEPVSLSELLVDVHRRYPELPLMITENGAAYAVGPGPDGVVHDAERIDYVYRHLGAVLDAIESGVDVQAYYAWSLLDNFEWALGYARRFGLVWVDFDSQQRIPKDSARWYADVIRTNALPAG